MIKIILSVTLLCMLSGCVVVAELPNSISERIIQEHNEATSIKSDEASEQLSTKGEFSENTEAKNLPEEKQSQGIQREYELSDTVTEDIGDFSDAASESSHSPEDGNLVHTNETLRPGQCYVQAAVYPQPAKQQQEIVIKDATKALSVVPSRISDGYQQVVTKQSHLMYEVTPPKFKKITEKIMVKPEIQKNRIVPAVYESQQQEVIVEEARSVLEPCSAAGSAYAHSTGVRSFCTKEIPAKTQFVEKEVLVSEERVETYVEPAKFKTVTRWELMTPANVKKTKTAPEVERVPYQEVLEQETIEHQYKPAVTRELDVIKYSGQAKIVTRQAVCDSNLNNNLLKRLQTALNSAGYNAGAADGYIGEKTITALTRYQKDHGLAVGAITYESLDKLLPSDSR